LRANLRKTELYHEIFGSILDREEMTPYLLRGATGYKQAMVQATRMLGNRGFDTSGRKELRDSEKRRAQSYVRQVRGYFARWLFPFLRDHLGRLLALGTERGPLYMACIRSVEGFERVLWDKEFSALVDADPRHLFLLAAIRKYPDLFQGHRGPTAAQIQPWQRMACAILKMGHLIKSLEEDSQEIHQYAQLGLFLESRRCPLHDLFHFDFCNPHFVPKSDASRIAYVKLSTFFYKLRESMCFDPAKGCHVFDSGDGVRVDIVDVKARLKSPESMLAKLGKDVDGEAYDIRDILAITFLLKSPHDSLTLFHALQKRGVILQENAASHSITQTLFKSPAEMIEAVRRLSRALAQGEGRRPRLRDRELRKNAEAFFQALSINAKHNQHSAGEHRKFQCKINFSLPIHRLANTHGILIPGTPKYDERDERRLITEQHTLPVELRISDVASWEASEKQGEAHHEAYKFRQLAVFSNRIFRPLFQFPADAFPGLRGDQARLFPGSST